MKNKNKDLNRRLPASTRINRNSFLLLIAQDNFQSNIKALRIQFNIPPNGFNTNDQLTNWTTWLVEDCEKRLNIWRRQITAILDANNLHDGLRHMVETYILVNRVTSKGDIDEQIGTNYRIFREHSKNDTLLWKSIFVEFLGPVSKEEMLMLQTKINKLMSVVMKSNWQKPLASKQNLKQAFEDLEKYEGFKKLGDTAYSKRGFRDLVDENEKMTERDILRQAEAKKKSIQRFKKKMRSKK